MRNPITGSNSVNVFLGLGFPYLIVASYYKSKVYIYIYIYIYRMRMLVDEGSIVNSSFSDFSYLGSASGSASGSGYTPGIPGEGKKGHRHYITPTFENHAIASHLSAISEGIEGLNDISMNHHSFINPPHINSPHIQPTKYYTATSLTKPFAPARKLKSLLLMIKSMHYSKLQNN